MNGYKLDRSHIFDVIMFDEFDRFLEVPEEWTPPETRPYTPGVGLSLCLSAYLYISDTSTPTHTCTRSLELKERGGDISFLINFFLICLNCFSILYRRICKNGLLMKKPETNL